MLFGFRGFLKDSEFTEFSHLSESDRISLVYKIFVESDRISIGIRYVSDEIRLLE